MFKLVKQTSWLIRVYCTGPLPPLPGDCKADWNAERGCHEIAVGTQRLQATRLGDKLVRLYLDEGPKDYKREIDYHVEEDFTVQLCTAEPGLNLMRYDRRFDVTGNAYIFRHFNTWFVPNKDFQRINGWIVFDVHASADELDELKAILVDPIRQRLSKKSFLKMFKLVTRDSHRVRFVCTNNLPDVPATWLPEENCYQVDETFKSGEEAMIYCRKHLFDWFADSKRTAEGPWGHHFQIRTVNDPKLYLAASETGVVCMGRDPRFHWMTTVTKLFRDSGQFLLPPSKKENGWHYYELGISGKPLEDLKSALVELYRWEPDSNKQTEWILPRVSLEKCSE